MYKLITLISLLSLMSCNNPNTSNPEINSLLDEFEWQLQKDLKDDGLNGSISMAIVKGNQLIRSKGFGIADLNEFPADTNSIYRIGSISKSFTAFLLMTQVQKGIISLDEPIEKYLPEVKGIKGYSDSTKFTFRQLASHTSGLAHLPEMRFVQCKVASWDSLLLTVLPKTHFISKPDEKYAYSNIGFGVLGKAISRAANKPFIELMESEVFEPLNMQSTFYVIPEEKMQHWAHGRHGGPIGGYDDERPRRELSGMTWGVPNGGIWSTANDLAKFMMANMGHADILNSDNLALMQTSQTPTSDWEKNYGLGFSIYQDSLIHTICHQGGTPGYRANLIFDKESEYGIILLRNYHWGITDLYLRSTLLLRRLREEQNISK